MVPRTCPAPPDADNRYTWSASGSANDGTAFTDFLDKMDCTDAPEEQLSIGIRAEDPPALDPANDYLMQSAR